MDSPQSTRVLYCKKFLICWFASRRRSRTSRRPKVPRVYFLFSISFVVTHVELLTFVHRSFVGRVNSLLPYTLSLNLNEFISNQPITKDQKETKTVKKKHVVQIISSCSLWVSLFRIIYVLWRDDRGTNFRTDGFWPRNDREALQTGVLALRRALSISRLDLFMLHLMLTS